MTDIEIAKRIYHKEIMIGHDVLLNKGELNAVLQELGVSEMTEELKDALNKVYIFMEEALNMISEEMLGNDKEETK